MHKEQWIAVEVNNADHLSVSHLWGQVLYAGNIFSPKVLRRGLLSKTSGRIWHLIKDVSPNDVVPLSHGGGRVHPSISRYQASRQQWRLCVRSGAESHGGGHRSDKPAQVRLCLRTASSLQYHRSCESSHWLGILEVSRRDTGSLELFSVMLPLDVVVSPFSVYLCCW